jgi:predicted ATP-binding protein involved in virulence
MYIEKLTLSNFRCFEKAELEFNYLGRKKTKNREVPSRYPNVNLLLGNNGTGKTSVLRGVVLGFLSPHFGGSSSGFYADCLVRRSGNDMLSNEQKMSSVAMVITDIVSQRHQARWRWGVRIERLHNPTMGEDIENIEARFWSDKDNTSKTKTKIAIFLGQLALILGYGANRRSERPEGYSESNRSRHYQRVAGLFEDHVGLVPFTYGYLQMKEKGRWDEARGLLNALLPPEVQLSDRINALGSPQFLVNNVLLPFSALSDGFKAFVGWVWDMLYQMALVWEHDKPLTEMPGVVIVDEIDLFMHPEWQRTVVQSVAETFPNLQFLFSTHSPLVAGTLEAPHIFVVEDGTVQQYRENLYGLSASQVLTSSYFGLSSTRAPGTENQPSLSDLAIKATNGDDAAAQKFLEAMAAGVPAE